MMFDTVRGQIQGELDEISEAGLGKRERVIASAQGAHVTLADGRELLNLCANNYLGLANHPVVLAAAGDVLGERGYGMASVRFICGTQDIHRELEARLSAFLGTEDTILYGSCFDANAGLFETLLGEDDAIISDALNHASIIDGVRLCKARRLRYSNGDTDELEERLREASGARRRLIATDGVFSMDGHIAPLPRICELAEQYDAMVMVDDSHAVGFIGPDGRGTPALHGVAERVDLITGTLGKALGGASGGYTSGRREAIELLRQRSRPYLFSNSLAPPIVAASLAVLDLLARDGAELRGRLFAHTRRFRSELMALGLDVVPGEHPIVPVMFGDAHRASAAAELLLEHGVYAVAFSYPVVPLGRARIRTQLSAALSDADVTRAVEAFAAVASA
jgi:glycine C-acetyltransferase